MKTNTKYLTLLLALGFVGLTYAQDNGDSAEGEPTTIQSLLELVKQGRTSEQNANSQREKEFMADKNKQAAILAAEKREAESLERRSQFTPPVFGESEFVRQQNGAPLQHQFGGEVMELTEEEIQNLRKGGAIIVDY